MENNSLQNQSFKNSLRALSAEQVYLAMSPSVILRPAWSFLANYLQTEQNWNGDMLNAFGSSIPHRQEILASGRCVSYLSLTLENYLASLGAERQTRPEMIDLILSIAVEETEDISYEARVHELLLDVISQSSIKSALSLRATRIFTQISHHLAAGSTLDYGCGDGTVGRLIQKSYGDVVLADVYRHPDTQTAGLPFVSLTQEGVSPLRPDTFHNVILCTVLHHSAWPLATLEEAARVTKRGGRIIVIESVYGVAPREGVQAQANEYTESFLRLTVDEQFAVNVFFDHFYNRCVHYAPDAAMKVNVPYNYQTAEGWQRIFEDHLLSVDTVVQLGIDQPLAPLFHTLYVLVKL
jgi:SAM-dependent methyltransferase